MQTSVLRGAPFSTGSMRPAVSKAHVSRSPLVVLANKRVQKKTKVILTKEFPGLGKEGEIKSVPVGYWRNFLLPSGVAKIADSSILEAIRKKKEDEIRKKMEEKALATAFSNALATIGKFMIKKRVGEKDQIYGSVTVKEVADAIYQQTGRQIPEADVTVPDIKAVGTYECSARLHPEVVASFSVVIQRDKQITIKTTSAKK
ncbi:hypothetical protein CEUSTIGMA_g11568.t1 [Chlamydomonas eustigma]|uniref:Large ribosomal subunit protein bL9c n=1 Tax=Chlamydomonas eustigma TaxID=1157962 RepID=A0A250XM11_9CHLO|nr:hypothetical protein CEUSTIGMA_g11568.t1 [Chlamydomonas eustigma]|eukprot:GAX84145.1 hypothetical protein CEUSTIGMA_g11568.t1 [Chlamydomonas eustigma]